MTKDKDLASNPVRLLADFLSSRQRLAEPSPPDSVGTLARQFPSAVPHDASRLAIAVSGGGDSVALLRLLVEAGAPGLRAYTVNHGLRPEAAGEAVWVGELCRDLGVPHRTLEWRWDGCGNLAEAARLGRYAALASACAADGVFDCLLGHTRDDNIETLFLGLLRGAGLDGLAGMRPSFTVEAVRFHRPLLEASRADLRLELTARGQSWHEDPTNVDLTHERARLRHLLAGLDLPQVRLAQSLRALAATRTDLGHELLARLDGAVSQVGPDLALDYQTFAALGPEFRRRAFAAALRTVAGGAHAPRAAQLLRLVSRDWSVHAGPVTLAGCRIWHSPRGLLVGRELSAVPAAVPSDQAWDHWRVNGPHLPGLRLGALGTSGRAQVDDSWRAARIPYASLLASPAVWEGDRVLATAYAEPKHADQAADWRFTQRDLRASFQAAVMAH